MSAHNQYPMCAEMLMHIFENFKLPIVWRHAREKEFNLYMENGDSVQLLTWCAKKVNYWAGLTGIRAEQLKKWEVPDLNVHLPAPIMSPDGLTDWTRLLLLLHYSMPPSSHAPSMSLGEEAIRADTRCPENARNRRARWLAARTNTAGSKRPKSPEASHPEMPPPRRPRLDLGRPRIPLDTAAIQRIQRWPQCAAILENFMRGTVEPAWRGLSEPDYVQKWRSQVHYSKDPENHYKETPRNPIDAFEYWTDTMSQIRPAMMKDLYDILQYTPNQPRVPSPPSSIMPDWTFAVHVIRWMVSRDPTVDARLSNAYMTAPLSLDLIDDIEHMYSDTADRTATFLPGPATPDLHAQVSRKLSNYTRPASPAPQEADDQTLARCIEKLDAYCARFAGRELSGFYGRIIAKIRKIQGQVHASAPDTHAISALIRDINNDSDENDNNSKFRHRFGATFTFRRGDQRDNIMDTLDRLPAALQQYKQETSAGGSAADVHSSLPALLDAFKKMGSKFH
jgi:hypothetical protein